MSDREDDEDAGIPDGVRDDKCRQPFGLYAVKKSPDKSADQSRHDQHEIERPDVNQRIDGCGCEESEIRTPFGG